MTNQVHRSARLIGKMNGAVTVAALKVATVAHAAQRRFKANIPAEIAEGERGDVPGWVLVVLMTTGLVTAIWTIAAPRLSSILRNSLDAMNAIR
ncbi:MAG: hypothetical protein H7227_06340 [Actinobacteria bacterium]|nr:hypothetical protein [Actinomycetota bacterium]